MASDYLSIRADNKRRYGTDIGRIGPMLMAERYDDRTHFIFELLQNAEDALARRNGWQGSHAVSFNLTERALRVSHFGVPFDEPDVRGICGIAESTKDQTAIGRFGIGFKSVYALTDRPEIHSGGEDFAIESFVWPVSASRIDRDLDETVILIPLRNDNGHAEIAAGLGRLGASSLLFLRQIEKIRWSTENGLSGLYLRDAIEVSPDVRRVTVVGQEEGQAEVKEDWLVFSRPVNIDESAGHVEIALRLIPDEDGGRESVSRVNQSPLVVFFPTVLETHLGFLVQGPYRTTPSRDNVPGDDAWNQRCVEETSRLLVDALTCLRDRDLLYTDVLRCLPLESTKFDGRSMFAPLFEATKQALTTRQLLPRFGGGHTSAQRAKMARTQMLRELFDAPTLAALFDMDGELDWLSAEISQDRTPELREYLMRELEIEEVTPEAVLPRLDADFLEAQTDDWVCRLYEFLNEQTGLHPRTLALPLIRLEDGTHVKPQENGQPQAFLPGHIETSFPTVRAAVCGTEAAREFLSALGLTEPLPVDDVIRNVLPKYLSDEVDVSDTEYEADIRRILNAFATDSQVQRDSLLAELRETPFVRVMDSGDASKCVSKPGEVYLATDRLKKLFAGVPDVLLVDDQYQCLRGEEVRELLEACGAVRYLRPIKDASLSEEEKLKLRKQAGHPWLGRSQDTEDWSLLGLQDLLNTLPEISVDERRTKTKLLWEELAHLEERRKGVFTGEYSWRHYGYYSKSLDSFFVRLLNLTDWVPDPEGKLQRPELVLFDSLNWEPNPFLHSKIRFKPPVIDQLAKEVGIEPGVLDLLKKHGITSEKELVARLRLQEEVKQADEEIGAEAVDEAGNDPSNRTAQPMPPATEPSDAELVQPGGDGGETGRGKGKASGQDDTKGTPESSGERLFISYVAAHPNDEDADPDGLDQSSRMTLEARAIDFILAREPYWKCMPAFNPGYDLVEVGPDARPIRWCEVKAMTRSLDDRPVGLSCTQFECAREHGVDYWLYVVEHADEENARIIRINDPAGKARTFTFDRGWVCVSEIDGTG